MGKTTWLLLHKSTRTLKAVLEGVGYGRGITLKGSLLIRREVYFACYQFKGCSRNEVFFFSWLKGRLPRTPRNGDEDDLSRISCSWDGLRNTMAYNVISCEKIERNTKRNENHWFYNRWFYNVNMAPELKNDQKSLKKTDHLIAIYSFFCIGMVYFGCLQVNPHIQAVQNMCGKGG